MVERTDPLYKEIHYRLNNGTTVKELIDQVKFIANDINLKIGDQVRCTDNSYSLEVCTSEKTYRRADLLRKSLVVIGSGLELPGVGYMYNRNEDGAPIPNTLDNDTIVRDTDGNIFYTRQEFLERI
jgi:hypothetical protein